MLISIPMVGRSSPKFCSTCGCISPNSASCFLPFIAAAHLPGMKLGWSNGIIVNGCPSWLSTCSAAWRISVNVVLV